MSTEENALIIKARLAEQAERYDEMAKFIKELVLVKKGKLSVDERNLLSVAFKNTVGARRASLRIISSLENKSRQRGNSANIKIMVEYQATIQKELMDLSNEVLKLLDDTILNDESKLDAEARVFFWKMRGDYYRYLAEFPLKDQKQTIVQEADRAYRQATTIAEQELQSTNPVRLGLALNFSVFNFEILGNPREACNIAKTAFDNAITQLESVDEEVYRDSTLIMQLLRDNLTLWTNEQEPGYENNEQQATNAAHRASAPLSPARAIDTAPGAEARVAEMSSP
uniref:14-3-3 protein beta/alpha-1-like n=1 Tax=Dermatophagoides pteronyssinus TaxID=6956 RepID=A0A6P6Y5T8_DERPT|nr:14-3-3 protein beta/alpha-1-like [Dermatophagoides pteronyssinus]